MPRRANWPISSDARRLQTLLDAVDHVHEHRPLQHLRRDIVAACVIRIDKRRPAVAELVVATMSESVCGQREGRLAVSLDVGQESTMRDVTEGKDHLEVWQQFELSGEELGAVVDYGTEDFIGGWNAPSDIGDVGVVQQQSIVSGHRSFAGGEACFMKTTIEPVTGEVAREDAPCSISAVSPGREADNEQPCV